MKTLKQITRKPWGYFQDLVEEKGKWHLKVIVIKKGSRLSLQRHEKRSEFWVVVHGKIRTEKGATRRVLKVGDTVAIKKKEKHRIEALSDSEVIEITFGIHNEKDITRLEDDYGRENK